MHSRAWGSLGGRARSFQAAGFALLIAWLATAPPALAQDGAERDGAGEYWNESRFLVDAPGTSGSLGAGLFNPAAWAMRENGGVYLAWENYDDGALPFAGGSPGADGYHDWIGIASVKALSFAMRRHAFEVLGEHDRHPIDYTLGIGGGSRGSAMGASYTWSEETGDRLRIGGIQRVRWLSFGSTAIFDLDRDRDAVQADLGLRPFGPRLTLFGEAFWNDGEDFEDIRTGYGVEVYPIRGIGIGAEGYNTGDFGLRLSLGLGNGFRPSMHAAFANDAESLARTYIFESGLASPPLQAKAGSRYPELELKGKMVYQRYRFLDDRRTLLGTLTALDRMADDPGVRGVVVNLSEMEIDSEMLWELREQLSGLRAHGKKVILYFDRAGMGDYLLASVADQIWMDPCGQLEITGLAVGKTYLREMFDKLGVGVEEWRLFTYKSAFETLSRTSMSEADREQLDLLVDDFYETIAASVTANRGISRAEWDRLIDEKGYLLPKEALAAGLIDSVGTYEEAKKAAAKADRRAFGDESAAHLTTVLGDRVWGPMDWGERDRIAVIYGIGECAMTTGIKGPALANTIKKAREDRRVKAVVFRADSPGGDPLPSDLVARELKKTAEKKPVIVSQGRVAGSGGYWISMYGDTIVASPLTITGSIGVIAGWLWDAGLGEKLGIRYDGVQRGAHADVGRGMSLPLLGTVVPDRNLTSEERARMEELMRTMYGDFVGMVAEGRDMTPEEVDAVGQGRVWSGTRGKEKGLVDEIGGLWRSLEIARDASGLPENRLIELTQAPEAGFIRFELPKFPSLQASALLSGSEAIDPFPGLSEEERSLLARVLAAQGRPIFMMEPVHVQDGSGREW